MDNESNCKHYLCEKLNCHDLQKDYEEGRMCALILADGTIYSYDISDRGENHEQVYNMR